MIYSYFLLLIFGLSVSLKFVLADANDQTLSSFEQPPKYLKTDWNPLPKVLNAQRLDKTSLKLTQGNRNLQEAIVDFKKVIPWDDHIEMTAECFMGILMNWWVANDKDLNNFGGPRTTIYHQKNLDYKKDAYGNADIVIERYIQGKLANAMIIELKGLGNQWSSAANDWEQQLCSYLLGYYLKNDGKTALGVISNMVTTRLYGCYLNTSQKKCSCWRTMDFELFGNGQTRNYGTFNYGNFDTFLNYLKDLYFDLDIYLSKEKP